MSLLRLLPLLAFLFLAGCTSVIERERFVPPDNPGGRMCTVQCQQSHDFCAQRCNLNKRTCVNKMQAAAMQDYDNYVREQLSAHLPVTLHASDFERREQCDPVSCEEDCGQSMRECYRSCGGRIDVITRCDSTFCL